MTDDGTIDRVVDPAALDPPETPRTASSVAGVLLAAGTSTRYGEDNKLLQRLDGEPIVRHAARTLVAADLDRVVVVVGHGADRVREAVADLPVAVVDNPEYDRGMGTSVRRGVESIDDADAAVFGLGDMPLVAPATVDRLVEAFRAGAGDPLAASYDGERGNPVLFGRRHFSALAEVDGDTGGRDLLRTAPDAALVATDDPGVRRDVDTPGDLDALREG